MHALTTVGLAGLASAWMLLWGAAALVPLVLHLLYRHRQQTVRWAAIELLRKVIQQHSRRIRVEQLLLLALRMLACILLAIALARPFFTTPNSVQSDELLAPPKLWVLVIDGSYSMGYRDQNTTRWDAAKDRATQIVRSAAPGDAFAVVQLGKPSQAIVSQVSFDGDAVASQIAQMRLADTGADLDSGLSIVKEILRDAQRDERKSKSNQIVFFTDLGKDTWRAAIDGPALQSFRQLAASNQLSIEPLSADIPANIAITSLITSNQNTLVDRGLNVTATVENFSPASIAKLPLQFQFNDSTVHTEFIDLASGESKTVTTEIVLAASGSSLVSALIPSDRLTVDDRRDLVVLARKQYQVLCVQDRADAARLVAIALAPDQSPTATIRVSTISSLELSVQKFSSWDAVILCNPRGISQSDAKKLIEFASSGRGVICLLAGEALADQWNATSMGAGMDLLGYQLLEPSAQQDWRLDPLGYASPIVQPFANFPDAGLLTTPIFRYWRLKPERNPGLVVDLAIENSDPLIVRNRVGMGWVASFLSAPMSGRDDHSESQPWNAIGTWPSFVPLVRQLLLSVTSGQAEAQNVVVGQMLSGNTSAAMTTLQPYITTPDGAEVLVTSSDANRDGSRSWSFGPTQRRGVYTLAIDSESKQRIAVNVDPIESCLESIPQTSLPQSQPEVRQAVLPSGSTENELPRHEFPARLILCLLAGVLIAESILAWSMGRRLA